mmetsp:Transcript_39722/g.91648  ORF Transcript_39722/g.91648 Transcript_39722/m.91648 type:complete len:1571 (-) Transcript_39722:66-4778(-)
MLRKICGVGLLLLAHVNQSTGTNEVQADDLPKCLDDAKDAIEWITMSNVEMPLGIGAGAWGSSRVVTDLYEILVRDVYGYATRRLSETSGSYHTYARCGGCMNVTKVDLIQPCPLLDPPIQHAALELWTTNWASTYNVMDTVLGGNYPDEAGGIGYEGVENIVLRQAVVEEGNRHEVPMEYYSVYNMSWWQPTQFLATVADINPSKLAGCYNPRGGTEELQAVKDLDPEGILEGTDGSLTLACWRESWWVSKRCRHDIDSCIPIVTGGTGWYLGHMVQKAIFHDWPVAIATALDWNSFLELPRTHSLMWYAWLPDTAFAELGVHGLVFPPYNADEWAVTNMRTQQQRTGIYKIAATALKRSAPTADALLRSMSVSEALATELMLSAERHPDGRRAGVCDWLRAHEDVWRSWLPDAQECFEGYGPVPASDGVTVCAPCQPGYASVRVNAPSKFVCAECLVGTFSSQRVSTACDECGPGHYSGQSASSCERCDLGLFQPLSGQGNCSVCPFGTTPYLAATGESDCNCPRDTFYFEGDNHTHRICQPCNAYMEECSGGEALGRQLPGYWMHPQNFEVFQCAGEDSCPGGVIGSCPNGAHGRTCSECDDAFYWTGKRCAECDSGQFFTPWVAIVTGVLILCVTYRFGNDPMTGDLGQGSQVIVLIGMLASVLFALSVFSTVDVQWVEPLKSFLNFAAVFSVDLAFFGVGCSWASGPLEDYVTYLCVPLIGALFCASAWMVGCAEKWKLFNTFSTIFYAFFIVTALLVLMPFRYIAHPGGRKTLREVPHIEEWSADHSSFIVVSFISCALYLASFVVVCMWSCWVLVRNPSKERLDFCLTAFRFLFYKFKPERFYWGMVLLLRNTMLAVVPVLSPESPQVQLFIFIALVVITLAATCWVQPWKQGWMNQVDTIFSMLLIMILCLGTCMTEPEEDSNRVLASILLAISGIVGVFVMIPFILSIWSTFRLRFIATEAERLSSMTARQSEDAEYREALNNELQKYSRAQVDLEQDAFEEINAMAAPQTNAPKVGLAQVWQDKSNAVDITQIAAIARQIRNKDYSVSDFRRDIDALCPEMGLYLVTNNRATSSGLTNQQELERTFGALFAVYWICRIDIDGREGFSMGVGDDHKTVQEVPSGAGLDPSELKQIPWAKMSPEQRRASFYWTFKWDLLVSIFVQAGILIESPTDIGHSHNAQKYTVDAAPDGRLVAMLVLTVIHDIMKNDTLCPRVTKTAYNVYNVGDTIHDHDAALAYVIDREPSMLPSYMALSKEQQRVVRFTQSDMGFNAGWLVQGEGPPSAVLEQFKKCISSSSCSVADVAFYFCHWVTDLAGAEPTPFSGSEKFAAKFPPAVLQGLLGSFGIVDKLASRTEAETYEEYLAARWSKAAPTLGPEPYGKDRIAKLRLHCMCQDETAAAETMRVWDAGLPEDDKAILLAELSATGIVGQGYSSGPIPGADIANPILVYYGPAWMQKASKQDALLSLQTMAEVYRACRSKFPFVRGSASAPTITVRIELLKKEEPDVVAGKLEDQKQKLTAVKGLLKENAPIFEVKAQNDVEGVLEWVCWDPMNQFMIDL